MQVVITAVGPDNRGLADPIIHHVTGAGANIFEIQMYDHDLERLFAMHLRCEWPGDAQSLVALRSQMQDIGRVKDLSIRTWSRDERPGPPRIAICTTYRPEPALAVLRAIRDKRLHASFPPPPAGASRDGSSTCITDCCRRSPVSDRTRTPTNTGCSPMERPSTSSFPSWTRAIRSFTKARSRSSQERRSTRSNVRARPITNRVASSKESAASSIAKSNSTSIAWYDGS